jgi:hypothetical protein
LLLGPYRSGKLPVELCEYEPPDEDDEDDYDCGYYVYASAAPVVALSHREVAPVRWQYLGKVCERADRHYRAAILTVDDSRWLEPWCEPALASTADGTIRVVEWSEHRFAKAIVIEGGDVPVALYLGLNADGEAVAIVLDACGLGGIRDDRDGDEIVHATQRALAVASLRPCSIPRKQRFDCFMPNLAEDVPRFPDDVYFTQQRDVTATLIGSLPLPTRTLGIHAGSIVHNRWTVAADRIEAFAFVDDNGDLAAWMLRVDDTAPVQWRDFGFGEDACSIGDAGGTEDSGLEVVDGGWPAELIGLARNAAGAPLLCIRGPDLTRARGAVGFDADGRVTTLVAVS